MGRAGLCQQHTREVSCWTPGCGGPHYARPAPKQLLWISAGAQQSAPHQRRFPARPQGRGNDLPILRQRAGAEEAQHQTITR